MVAGDSAKPMRREAAAADDSQGGGAEPVLEDGVVDRAEVDVVLEVAVVEFGQAGRVAEDPRLPRRPGDVEGRARAVMSPLRAVLATTPPELGEGHHHHVVQLAEPFQVAREGLYGLGNRLQQRVMRPRLPGVREAADGDVEDLSRHAEIGRDELGDRLEAAREVVVRVLRGAAVAPGDGIQLRRRVSASSAARRTKSS